jgi:hypothetical protein
LLLLDTGRITKVPTTQLAQTDKCSRLTRTRQYKRTSYDNKNNNNKNNKISLDTTAQDQSIT